MSLGWIEQASSFNKAFLALGVLLSISSVFAAVKYSRTFNDVSHETPLQKKQKFYEPATVTEAPLVVSKIKDLEITEVRLKDQGTPQASISIDVTNKRDSAVMSLEFVSGGKGYNSGLSVDGLLQEGTAEIIIPPQTLQTFTWFLGEIMQGETVFLAAAIFADGKEEGDKRSLKGIKVHRRNFQQKQREVKAKNGGQQ